MVDALETAINLVAERKQWYKNTGQSYYPPWIVLITDGKFVVDRSLLNLAQRKRQDTASKKYIFLPIGVNNANMSVLQQIQGQIPVIKLKGTKFSSFFKYISIDYYTEDESENWADYWTLNL